MGLTIKTEVQDTATPELRFVRSQVTPHRLAAELGPRMTRLVQRNFRSLGGNKAGWPSTNFWGRAAESTNWQEGFGFVMISVNQIGVRQRLMGGDIKPVNAKMLTFPASPEAYGKTAGDFSNLQFKFVLDPSTGRMRPALVEKAGTPRAPRGKGKKREGASEATGLVALFWLARGAHQEPSPNVMPQDAEFEAEMDKTVDVLLRYPIWGRWPQNQ